MQDPSVVRIPDDTPPVKPPAAPKPKFPLPDHQCDRQGVPRDWTGEWDSVEDFDLGHRIIWNAMERTSNPMSLFQMYLSNKLLAFAEAYLPTRGVSSVNVRYWPKADPNSTQYLVI